MEATARNPFRPQRKRSSSSDDTSAIKPRPVAAKDLHENGAFDPAKVELGQSLFFDKILSGNFNISCATCHHPMAGTGDGLSLPVGEAGIGLGITRITGDQESKILERVPRNAPPLFNLAAKEFRTMFHDGRVQPNEEFPSGFQSPAGHDLPEGLENAIAVQAMFPPTSGTEMAGQAGENPVGDAAAEGRLSGPGGVWDLLAKRVAGVEAYANKFAEVYDDVSGPDDITMVHAANAIAAFEMSAFRADRSPFDRYLAGEKEAMSASAKRGMDLFYGKARCATCHSGQFQTDHGFYAIGMPQIGPGKGDGDFFQEDFGRLQVTKRNEDRMRFRTPSLRNVALTAPYGHSGAYDTLDDVVRHHLQPMKSLSNFDTTQLTLPYDAELADSDLGVMEDLAAVSRIAGAIEIEPISLSDVEQRRLMDFLNCLTDPSSLDMRKLVPKKVLSGISVFD